MTTTVPTGARPKNPGQGLTIKRIFTKPGVHPYDEVTWTRRDVILVNWRDQTENFRQEQVEFPDFWTQTAVDIVASKWFRGALGTDAREGSLRQIIDRVVGVYRKAGEENGYFATADDAEVFAQEMTYALLHQFFTFNSPVWFNVGTAAPQQVSACFILAVDDSVDSILDWVKEEGLIFKGGSGAGVNLSRLRANGELLSSGGTASGPVSFMRGADASAGTIKSGGATRRAAKMVLLDVDHPDVEEFIDTKVREEDKIRVLRDAGFDMDLDGADMPSVQFQNANNSVRLTDEFMRQVEAGGTFPLTARLTGETVREVEARGLFRRIADAAWACADPGVQFSDTINHWHTCPESGRINGSNPCSEYVHLDNSSCNLASLNLLRFLREDRTFDHALFAAVVELVITAMDISICFADFPTPKITEVSRAYRQLGIGYANLGAMLMAAGLPYDSDEGRSLAGAVTSLMTGTAYRRSTQVAAQVGPYDGYAANADAHQRVFCQHEEASQQAAVTDGLYGGVWRAANEAWAAARKGAKRHGIRNAQASLLAPTGTSGLTMGVDTTGIEPDFSLVKYKKLVGGASMTMVNGTVERALAGLGYAPEDQKAIVGHIVEMGHVVGAPGMDPAHYAVFDCANGERAIAPMGHVRMMAAVQPFLSGAISKTCNLPESATVEDIERLLLESWKLGLKCVAVYRDNCKVGQPLSSKKSTTTQAPAAKLAAAVHPRRRRLPRSRQGISTSFAVGGAEGYMTANSYPEDDGLGEVFLKMSKQGSTLAGMMDAFSIAISVGLQHGVPLETYASKFTNMRFEPAGLTDDPDVRMAQSIVDYIFRRLALDFLPFDTRSALGIHSAEERQRHLETGSYTPVDDEEVGVIVEGLAQSAPVNQATATAMVPVAVDAPLCLSCGTQMRRAGSCFVCEGCGGTSGCS